MNISRPSRRPGRRRRFRAVVSNAQGAIDLASIMTGVLVVGIIGAVIAATVFAVIPWSQDSAAKGDLATAGQVERAVRTTGSAVFLRYDSTDPAYRNLEVSSPVAIQRPDLRLIVDTNNSGTGYVAAQLSQTGQVWLSTSEDPTPRPAADAGYVLASYNGHPTTGVSALTTPLGLVIPEGIASAVPQSMIHALVTRALYFAASAPTPGARVMLNSSDSGFSLFQNPNGVHQLTVSMNVPTSIAGSGKPSLPTQRAAGSYGDAAADWVISDPRVVGDRTIYDFVLSKAATSALYWGFDPAIPISNSAESGTYNFVTTISATETLSGTVSKTETKAMTFHTATPGDLTVSSVSSSTVALNWTASPNAVSGTKYEIYRDGVLISTVSGLTFTDSGLQGWTHYSYTSRAVTPGGTYSWWTNPLDAQTH
jgi:hypothetical protein